MLLLFDVDGTLLLSHGLGRRLVEQALSEVAGVPVSGEGVAFAGRTDPAIATDMLTAAGINLEERPTLLEEALRHYAECIGPRLASGPVTVLPGVRDLLDLCSTRAGVGMGLVTGNLEVTAFAKLSAGRIDHHFRFGAYGSDHHDRNALPAVALERACAHTGRGWKASEAVIIGDTPHDIACARAGGMVAVAVATGGVSREELEACGPDLLLDDLSDTRPLLDFLGLT